MGKSKPTITELAKDLENTKKAVAMIDGGLREMVFIFQKFLEREGKLIDFNTFLAEERKKYQKEQEEKNGNTD